jgi:hypothetical protein
MERRASPHHRHSHPRAVRLGVALAVDAALIAAAFLVSGIASGRTAARAEASAAKPAPRAESAVAPGPAVTAPAGSGARRSPLQRSPGYYPPDDPESLSVVTGRRRAQAVDLDLDGGARTIEDLARHVLAAIHARDERALHALRLTRREFETICWPEFPESRPITRITAADAWDLSLPTSLAGAGRTVGTYGGRPLELIRVDVAHRQPYRNFRLHRGVVIVARDGADGSEIGIRFLPSIVERNGRFKALLFHD